MMFSGVEFSDDIAVVGRKAADSQTFFVRHAATETDSLRRVFFLERF